MSKKKFFKSLGLFLIPVVIGVALYSQSNTLFKGSLTSILAERNYSVEISFPNTSLKLIGEANEESIGNLSPIYINNTSDSYQIKYATNIPNTKYNLNIISSDIKAETNSIKNGRLEFGAAQETLKKGVLNNLQYIKENSTIIGIEHTAEETNSYLNFINWDTNCRYDTNKGEEITPTELSQCDPNLYHYLELEVLNDSEQKKTFILPVVFEDPLGVTWTFPAANNQDFISVAEYSDEESSENSTTALYKTPLDIAVWAQGEDELRETISFNPDLSTYNYSIKLIQKDNSFYETWENESSDMDILKLIKDDNDVSGPSTYEWEVFCDDIPDTCNPDKFQALEIKIQSRDAGNANEKKFIFPLKNKVESPEINFLNPYVSTNDVNWPNIEISNGELNKQYSRYLANAVNINPYDFTSNTNFVFSNTSLYDYEVMFIQKEATERDLAANILNLSNALASGTESPVSLSSETSRQGISEFSYNEICTDTTGSTTECVKEGYNNYLVFKFLSTYPNPAYETDETLEANLSRTDYRIIPLDFTTAPSPNLTISSPFQAGPTSTSSSSVSQNINIEDPSPYLVKFYTNQNLNYEVSLKRTIETGETTLKEITSGTSTAFNISTFAWDKVCGDEVAATETTPAHPLCNDLLGSAQVYFELKIKDSTNTDLFTYKIPVNLQKELNIKWQEPFTNKSNSDFTKLNFSSSAENESELAYLYPYKKYVNLSGDPSEIFFLPTSETQAFKIEGYFTSLEDSQTYLNNFTSRNRFKFSPSDDRVQISQFLDTYSYSIAWNKSCDETESCLDFSNPAIEIVITSVENETEPYNEGNSTSYIFPVTFAVQDTPKITLNSPKSEEEGETPILVANTTSTQINLSTDIPSVCKANTANDFDLADEDTLSFNSADLQTTTHTLTINELENEETYLYYVKCFNPEDPSKISSIQVPFSIGKEYLNITWQSPSADNSDFEIAHNDTSYNHTYLYQDTLSANSNTSGSLNFNFTATNEEISYKTYVASLDEDFDIEELLENIPTATPSGFKSLSSISGNEDTNYKGDDIISNTANTVNWDKQCYDSSNSTKTACSANNTNLILIKVETKAYEAIEDDPATTELDESKEAVPSETYWYFFELSIGEDPVISSCELSGDEVIFNRTTEDLVFTFDSESENIENLEATLSLEKTDGTVLGELYSSTLSSNSGTYTWNGEISNVGVINGKYTAKLNLKDANSETKCETSWNFLANDKSPRLDGDLEISLEDTEIVIGQSTTTVHINTNKDSFNTVVNIYDNTDTVVATLYKCIAGEDTATTTIACPRTVSFEWDGSHQVNYLKPGRYYLKGTMQDSNGIHIGGISNDFNIKENLTPGTTNPSTSSSNSTLYPANCNQYFSDIAPNNPACSAVTYVRESGIFKGTDRGTIELNSPITRLEMITVTNRIKEQIKPSIFNGIAEYHPVRDGNMGFSDLNTYVNDVNAKWFMDEIWKAKQVQLIKGYQDGTIKPNQFISGPETFKLIQLAREANSSTESKNPWYQDYLTFNYINNINVAGIQEGTPAVTRGQVIEYLYSLYLAGF